MRAISGASFIRIFQTIGIAAAIFIILAAPLPRQTKLALPSENINKSTSKQQLKSVVELPKLQEQEITPIAESAKIQQQNESTTPTDVKGIVRQKAAERGWVGNEWDALESLVMHESTWNASAINPSSGACGLFQALPCSKIGAPLDNVAAQADWGLSYIAGRYGSPSGALAAWQARSPHWY